MTGIGREHLDRALALLGELLAHEDRPAQHFVVCGGSSLIALQLARRATTRDVDILARVDDGVLVQPSPLPDWLVRCASAVATELGLVLADLLRHLGHGDLADQT